MRLLIISFLLVFSASSLSAQWGKWKKIKGSGNIVSKDWNVDDFTEVKSCCSMKFIVSKGSNHSVRIETDDNLQEYLEAVVSGRRLSVKTTQNINMEPSQKVKVYVTMPELEGLYASSSSKLMVKDPFEGDELEIDVSSSADITVDFTANRVDISGSSSGEVELKGSAKRTKVKVSSSCKVDASDFKSEEVDARASSSGKVSIRVQDRLDADVSSGAKVEYRGNPERVYTDASSGGKVRKID